MKKTTFFSILMLFMSVVSFAQAVFPCGFDEMHQKRLIADKKYDNAVREMDNRWIKYASLASTAVLTYTPKGYVYEIPMVIHVLHTGGSVGSTYNPDSSTIAAMVDFLNKSYEAVYPFQTPDSGGAQIPLKFVLAKRSPTGASTNGIIRLDASSIPNYTAYGANANTSSGVDPDVIMAFSRWPPADYYNVYSVNKIDGNDLTVTGGIAGYAYFPGTPTLDGMIVCATQIRGGTTTVSHEFGHGFGLYHTFQGDGTGSTCPTTSPCASTGDLICDTEPHRRSSSFSGWCPPSDANPCTGGASYNFVQYNIMDYTQCPYPIYGASRIGKHYRYTPGQRDRVMNTLNNQRTGFKSSLGLLAPTGTVTAACIPTSSGTSGSYGPYIVNFNGNEVWTGSLDMEDAAYVDHSYTQQSYVVSGGTYPIDITTRANRQNVKVYIDYNNDGDFADAGEEVYTHSGTTSNEVHSGSITIPSSVTKCTWLRMRVVAAWYGATISDWACGPYSNNAQAEDYAIYVKDRTAADTVTIAQTAGTNPSCTGEMVTFTATPGSGTPTYRWFINGSPTSVTTNTYSSTTLNDKDVITCKIYYTGSCGSDSSESDWIQLEVSSTAAAVANNSLKVGSNPGCPGQALVFKANVSGGGSAPTYIWYVNGAPVGSADTFASSSLSAGDEVWCNVTPNSACSTTPVNTDTIMIAFAPITSSNTIALTSGTIPSCDSTNLTFTCTPTNGGTAPTYQWYVNGVALPGATNYFLADTAFKDKDTVTCKVISNHTCIVTGSGDTSWSNEIVVVRNPRTVPTLDVAITKGFNPGCLDSLLEFTATATDGGAGPTIVWYVNRAVAAYGPVYGSAFFSDGDTLTCKMYVSAASCTTVDSLEWGPLVLKLSATPASPIISLIGTLLVSSIPTGIQWYGPDGLIPGATGPTYHPTKEGNYYAVVVNDGCPGKPSNILNVAILKINPLSMTNLALYPNPSTGYITMDWGNEPAFGQVDVFTVTGQKLLSEVIDNEMTHTLNLSQYADGNYFVIFRDVSGKVGTVSITLHK